MYEFTVCISKPVWHHLLIKKQGSNKSRQIKAGLLCVCLFGNMRQITPNIPSIPYMLGIPDNPPYLIGRVPVPVASPDFSLYPYSLLLLGKNWPKMMTLHSYNTIATRIFGLSVIKKKSENDHIKFLCVIFEVMNGNLIYNT